MPGTLPTAGVDRCRIVTYGEAYKDANELLVAEGPDALLKALEDAPIPRLEGTFTAEDLREGLHQLFEEGYTSGVELGIPNLDEIMSWKRGGCSPSPVFPDMANRTLWMR